ncbi:glycosyltransferase [Arenicella sp. 4NH20-0111]|uniref:glycosyltransferase n=1 Tax=Arenicella sp. 4NH20-0111 TaxID=3127648 RepID=UPI003106D8D4
MAKADLHVHSKYSDHPSTWGHKVYQSPESFTEVETVYRQAKRRGMDFVTLTDHDDIRGSLELTQSYPNDTFMSCEVTTFFPEDNCKVHVLVYGLDEEQYLEIMDIRMNIYRLRDYILEQNLAYSVAHATYDQDGKLGFEHIEKLVILFDVFEIINGGSDSQNNLLLHRYLQNLSQSSFNELQSKHGLEPMSSDPWIKGFTGGSDDHCGILIGSAYTQSVSDSPDTFLESIRNKKSLGNGMHGSFETYATGVIKHIHDYRLARDKRYSSTKMSDFLDLFYSGKEGNLMKRFKKSQSLRYLKKKNNKTHNALHRLLKQISQDADHDMARKIPNAYVHINELHDEMFSSVVTALTKHLPGGDIFKGFQRLATLFPMTLLAAPFIGSMRHQVLKSNIKRRLLEGTKQHYTEKALWFTDTIDDLNGVSVSLRQIATHGANRGYLLKLVTCVDQASLKTALPKNTLNLPPIKEVQVPGYEQQTVGFPSLLSMMRKISLEQPDQIIISTPGPLGLGALLCAKLMDLPVKMVYHTDFAEQIIRMTNEPMLAKLSDGLVNAFYKQADQVFVPSNSYIKKLSKAGIDDRKLAIFPRGLDLDLYHPKSATCSVARRKQLHGEFTLMFAGRISADKNLTLLTNVARLAERTHKGRFNWIIAGDGPDLTSFKESMGTVSNVHFTGRIDAKELVECYRSADLFVFPSHTDTFGMVVLEAQACGLPCLVTTSGGPKEIIIANETGSIVDDDSAENWLNHIIEYHKMKQHLPDQYSTMQSACFDHVKQQNNWQPIFDSVLGSQCLLPHQHSSDPTTLQAA